MATRAELLQKDRDRAIRMRDKARALLKQQGNPNAADITRFAKGLLDGEENLWLLLASEVEFAIRFGRKDKKIAERFELWTNDRLHELMRRRIIDPVLSQWDASNAERYSIDDAEWFQELVRGSKDRYVRSQRRRRRIDALDGQVSAKQKSTSKRKP